MVLNAMMEGDSCFREVSVRLEDKGIVTCKKIPMADFLSLLQNSAAMGQVMRIGRLPQGYYDGALSPAENTFKMAVSIPAAVRPVQYFDTVYVVPFPALMFIFCVATGRINVSEVVALDTDVPQEDSIVYHYPFGNVYNDGKICWGNIALPSISNPLELPKAISGFFASETNNDLYEIVDGRQQRQLLEELSNADTFPKRYLRKNEKIGLLSDFLKEIRE